MSSSPEILIESLGFELYHDGGCNRHAEASARHAWCQFSCWLLVISVKLLPPHFLHLKWLCIQQAGSYQTTVYIYVTYSALRTNINFSSDTRNVHLSLVDPTLPFFPIILVCSPSSFRLSLSMHFRMHFGSWYEATWSARLWTTYPAHLPNPFGLVTAFNNSLILETALLSTQSPGVSPQFFNPKGLEFHKEILQKCMTRITFQSPRILMFDALQMVVLLRLRLSLGFVLSLLKIWFLSQPDRKINFMSPTRKHSTI